MSRSLEAGGPNATLVVDDVAGVVRGLKERLSGEVAVSGTVLAQSLGELGLIDDEVIRLTYVPV